MKGKKKIMVLAVAYNAKDTIRQLLNRIPKETYREVDEILIADDASQDNTSEVALDYKMEHNLEKIKIIRHGKNKGYGGNQKWGYNYAMENNFDIVVMIHGDAQYPSEYISSLIQKMEQEKAAFVFGSRITGHPMKGGMPVYKFIGNKFLTSVENLILRSRLSEFHSGFRAYSVKALKEIPFNENSDGFHFDSELIIQLIMAKKKISEITIPTFYGDEKCNVNSIKYGFNILKVLGEYILHQSTIKKYPKFSISHTNKA
jgi:glycosyltransferase involved in cell wall biosynthesis